MKVARQFYYLEWVNPKPHPVLSATVRGCGTTEEGYGLSYFIRAVLAQGGGRFPPIQSHRTLRDGSFLGHIPGSKVPGYHHRVLGGQKAFSAPVHNTEATSQSLFEDSLPDEAFARLVSTPIG
jgi:hypothetical protein